MSEPIDFDVVERALQAWVVTTSGISGDRVIWSGRGGKRPASPWISLQLDVEPDKQSSWVDTEPNPLTFDPIDVTADPAADTLTASAHGFASGDGPIQLDTDGDLPTFLPSGLPTGLPTGLEPETDYWIIRIDANTVRLAASFADAIADTPTAVEFDDEGTGQLQIIAVDESVRAGAEVLQVVRTVTTGTLSVQCYGVSPTGNTSPVAILHGVAARADLPSVEIALGEAGVSVWAISAIRNVGAVINTTAWEPRAQMDVTLQLASEVSETATIIEEVEGTFEIECVDPFDFHFPGDLQDPGQVL